jgi:membrane protein required for beta-lactamase induction
MEHLSVLFAVLGALSVSWGGIRYLLKNGLIARFCLTRYDAGVSKIHDVTYSACYIVAGFLLFLLSSLTTLYNTSHLLLYVFTVLSCVGACGLVLLYAPKRIIAREKEQMEKIKLATHREKP